MSHIAQRFNSDKWNSHIPGQLNFVLVSDHITFLWGSPPMLPFNWLISGPYGKMYLHYTVHLYCTLYHNDQRSVSKKVACEEDLREKWNGDLWGHMEVARNIWLWFICRKPLGRIGHNMLKWLVIQLLNRFLIKVMIVLLLGRLKIGVTVVMPKYILWK